MTRFKYLLPFLLLSACATSVETPETYPYDCAIFNREGVFASGKVLAASEVAATREFETVRKRLVSFGKVGENTDVMCFLSDEK